MEKKKRPTKKESAEDLVEDLRPDDPLPKQLLEKLRLEARRLGLSESIVVR
jgi:hypothetical protein